MLAQKDILDAVDAELTALFPGLKLYRNLVPVNFDRPSAMTRLTAQTMEFRTRDTVQRGACAVITLFSPVDSYHNTDVDDLFAQSDQVMEHFSAPCMSVCDRFLDIGRVTCNVEADFAEVTVPLAWDDDRKLERQTAQTMEILHLEME